MQNLPNPWGRTTAIEFVVPKAATPAVHVDLRVYDPEGRLVKTLADKPFAAGRRTVAWTERPAPGRRRMRACTSTGSTWPADADAADGRDAMKQAATASAA